MAATGYVLGIDYGAKRVGLALASAIAQLPAPYMTIDATSDVVAEIKRIIEVESVQQLVLGMPRNMDGSLGFQAKDVEEFGEKLTAQLEIPLTYVEETLSTVDAVQSGVDPKLGIDAQAAAVILERYFDEKRAKERI
jgi:putative Holliday junction resolvase